MPSQKRSVFVSYAHKDNTTISEKLPYRIVTALNHYMDVYWDRGLKAGKFASQLFAEIDSREFFLFLLSPHSINSEWCQREFQRAETQGKQIAIARLSPDTGSDFERQLKLDYIIADFTKDFEKGFRQLTALLFGYSISSWEHAAEITDNSELLSMLEQGLLPGIVAKEFASWVVAEVLWQKGIQIDRAMADNHFYTGATAPYTPTGLITQCDILLEQFELLNDVSGYLMAKEARTILEEYVAKVSKARDDNHEVIGKATVKLCKDIREFLLLRAEMANSVTRFTEIQNYFDFAVLDKLQELVKTHSARVRHLY